MTLGVSRPRNYGKELQQALLAIACLRGKVAYKVQTRHGRMELRLAPSAGGLTLPFNYSVATLLHPRRGRWEARHPFDDRLLATGISQRDVIRATINAVWH